MTSSGRFSFEGFWNEDQWHALFAAVRPVFLGRDLFSQATYEGPAYMTTYMSAIHDGNKVESRLAVTHIPLTLDFLLKAIFWRDGQKSSNDKIQNYIDFIQGYVDKTENFNEQNLNDKIYIPDPVVCDGDGPLHKLRKWYGQFLVNRDDVPTGLDLAKREF